MPALQAVGFSHSEQESNDRKQPSVCEFVMPHVMYLTSILLSYSKCLCNEVFVNVNLLPKVPTKYYPVCGLNLKPKQLRLSCPLLCC